MVRKRPGSKQLNKKIKKVVTPTIKMCAMDRRFELSDSVEDYAEL